jgi:hypothetical protein
VPKGFEERKSPDEVRCLQCKKADPTGQGIWIKYSSAVKHLDSVAHATAIKKLAALEAEELEHAARRTTIYRSGQSSAPLGSGFGKLLQSSSSAPTAMFNQAHSAANLLHDDRPELSEPIGQFDYHPNHEFIIPSGVQPLTEDSNAKSQRFLEMYEMMLLQADHEDKLGRDEGDEDFDFEDAAQNIGMIFYHKILRLLYSICFQILTTFRTLMILPSISANFLSTPTTHPIQTN